MNVLFAKSMNEASEKLIRELAEKLGTTAEHLWGVLIRQAAISGITNLFVCAAWCALLIWAYKLVCRKTTVPMKTEENQYPYSEWNQEGGALAWLVLGITVAITIGAIGLNLEYIVGALANPEYWALKQIVR